MFTLLDSAHTWFFESLHHELCGAPSIRLVEGIKATEHGFVEVGTKKLGPFFPVNVEVKFENVILFQVVNEFYDTKRSLTKTSSGRFLYSVGDELFGETGKWIASDAEERHESCGTFILWCEDRIFQIITVGIPNVVELDESPNLTLERTETWSASE